MTQNCYKHLQSNAIGSCHYCGRRLCSLCCVEKKEYLCCSDTDDCLKYQEETSHHKEELYYEVDNDLEASDEPHIVNEEVSGNITKTRSDFTFFSWKGRIPRSHFFGIFILSDIVAGVCLFIAIIILMDPYVQLGGKIIGYIFLFTGLIIPAIMISFAIVRRAYDLNYGGWSLIMYFIPIIQLLYWLELFFVKGTVGTNKFGVDPLQKIRLPQLKKDLP